MRHESLRRTWGLALGLGWMVISNSVVARQTYGFMFRGENMKPGERLHTGNHAKANNQDEGEDMGAMRYLGDGKWSPYRKGNGSANSDFVVYEKEVYAVAAGKVVGCWRNAPENPSPDTLHEKFVTGTKKVNGQDVDVGPDPRGREHAVHRSPGRHANALRPHDPGPNSVVALPEQ